MSDVSVQFYADLHELVNFLSEWVIAESVFSVAMSTNPFFIRPLAWSSIADDLANPNIWRVYLYIEEPDLSAKTKADFEIINVDGLAIDIGRRTEDGLCQSWLACRTTNEIAINKWRRIARNLKKKTKCGVTTINRQSHVDGFNKSLRYTSDAEKLERSGVQMLSVGGIKGPLVKLGDQRRNRP